MRIGHTLKHLREDKQVFWFLLAFFCYIDGVYTIIGMATAYGTALGLSLIHIFSGSEASARAMATRCCWPPESWRG